MGLTILVAQPVSISRAKLWKIVVKCEIVMFFNLWVFLKEYIFGGKGKFCIGLFLEFSKFYIISSTCFSRYFPKCSVQLFQSTFMKRSVKEFSKDLGR